MHNSLKDKVLDASDIVDVIGESVQLVRKGREFVGLCPFHNDRNPSMSVSPQKQIFKCWACGAGGDVIRFVEMYQRCEFKEALAWLAQRAGLEVRSDPAEQRSNEQREAIRAAVGWAGQHFRELLENTPAGRAAREYARRRGLTDETIDRFSLGFAADDWTTLYAAAQRRGLPDDVLRQAGLVTTNEKGRTYDRFRNRLIFPIADSQGRVVAFGGRALGEDSAKYLNSPETPLFSKSRILYGFNLARKAIDAERTAIVVEGYMDAVMLHQYGFSHVVATLGTALTDAHVKQLKARADLIYLCFDGDVAGVAAADRAVAVALQTQSTVRVVLLRDGQDPADCVLYGGAEAFKACLNDAVDALEFKWSQTLRAFGDESRAARRAATEEYLQFVAGATQAGGVDPLQQNLLIGRLSQLLGVPPDVVFELLADARRRARRGAATAEASADDISAYEGSIRGVSAGMVTATETVLGLLASDSACWQSVNDTTAHAAGYSRTWQQLYQVLLEVHEDVGEYSVGQVLMHCEDGALCELLSRARARVLETPAIPEQFQHAQAALEREVAVVELGGLQADLQAKGGDDAEVFRRMQNQALGQHSAVPTESRWNARR